MHAMKVPGKDETWMDTLLCCWGNPLQTSFYLENFKVHFKQITKKGAMIHFF